MPDLPASVYGPAFGALVAALVYVFRLLNASRDKHLSDQLETVRVVGESTRVMADVAQLLPDVLTALRQNRERAP